MDLVNAALRNEIVLATMEGKEAAIRAMDTERKKALENQQSLGRSGDVDVIDLREDNAFMQARNQALVHQQNLAELRKLAEAIVVEPSAEQGILPLGTEFRVIVEYEFRTKTQHCRLGGPCEQLILKKTETGATWLSYKSSMGGAIWLANVGAISKSSPIEFRTPTGIARIISFEVVEQG